MKRIAALFILGFVTASDTYTKKYMNYLSQQGKSYNSIDEFNVRLANFIAIDKFIDEWNALEDETHTVGHNFLSDWTQEEKDFISGKATGNQAKPKAESVNLTAGVFEPDLNDVIPPANWTWNNGVNLRPV